MRLSIILALVFGALLVWTLQSPNSSAIEDADVLGDFGDAIPGLTAFDSLRFKRGLEVFKRRFDRLEGLGPHFNATSCMSCHEHPVAGGSSPRYRDFFLAGRALENGGVEKLYPDCTEENAHTAGTELCLPSLVIPNYGPRGSLSEPVSAAVEHPPIPAEADVVARRNAPPVFGIGLFRFISDAEILSRADPDDLDGDGVSGRVNVISSEEGAIGRFGYKCQTASLEAFNRGALHNQMGITSDSLTLAQAGAGEAHETPIWEELFSLKKALAQVATPEDRIVDYDGVPDPEITRIELQDLIFFQENLAAPRRGRITAAVRRGETHFAEIGCASCHTPTLETSIGCIHPYTDLLIHDMGPDLADGIHMERANGSEFRTQPLWGLCQHGPFLHDGRADTVEQAILAHGGEAEASRDRYSALSEAEKQDLHRFLESL